MLQPFEPIISNPHIITIAGNFWPRTLDTARFPVVSHRYETAPGIRVLVQSQRPEGQPKGEIVMVHGLEGSCESGYMKSLSQAGLEAGYAMNRFNMRSCGPGMATECPTLYNAGLTEDLLAVLRLYESEGRTPVYLAGFSLGGNVVLKLAGELGTRAGRYVRAVCAVSTPIHLGRSAERIGKLDNRIYERRFLRRMIERLRATGKYCERDFAGVNSIVSIDDKITAPFFGFRGAQHYYETQSAVTVLDRIAVPTLFVQAKDDTFIPFEIFNHPAFETNPNLTLLATERGGHLGYISKRRPRFWVDGQVLDWVGRHPVMAEKIPA